jgi:hypothetical protein
MPDPDIVELPEPALAAIAGGASDTVMPRTDDPLGRQALAGETR